MKYILLRIGQIARWRWILAITLIFGLSFDAYTSLYIPGMQPSIYEIILIRTDDPAPLTIYFILLLLIADLGFGYKKTISSKITFNNLYNNYIFITTISIIFIACLIIGGILVSLLNGGFFNFKNEWLTMQKPEEEWLTPQLALLISTPFFLLKLIFLTMTVYTVNRFNRKLPLGYLAGLTFCMIDAIGFYNLSVYLNPIWIFPFEHSYLGTLLNHTNNILINVGISILYWSSLLVIIGLMNVFITKNKDRKENHSYEANH